VVPEAQAGAQGDCGCKPTEESESNYARVQEYFKTRTCVDCPVVDPDVLTFDHVRGEKKSEVSKLVSDGYSWKTIWAEIQKCVVRCWNCHMKRTFRRRRALTYLRR
jgi:hypothetical protein